MSLAGLTLQQSMVRTLAPAPQGLEVQKRTSKARAEGLQDATMAGPALPALGPELIVIAHCSIRQPPANEVPSCS